MPKQQVDQYKLDLEEIKAEDIANLIRMCDEALNKGEVKV
jgi:hypothetical protein